MTLTISRPAQENRDISRMSRAELFAYAFVLIDRVNTLLLEARHQHELDDGVTLG